MVESSSEIMASYRRRWRALRYNPVAIKELRSQMRGRRAFMVLIVHLLVMSLFISLVYSAYTTIAASPYGPSIHESGKAIFAAVVLIEVCVVILVVPSFTSGSISGEKERKTYELLRTTLLSANAFVTGKLISALGYIFLLIFVSVPLLSFAFLLGGLSVEELVIGQSIILLAALTFALFGLYCSSAMRSTLAANTTTLGVSFAWSIGLPLLALFVVGVVSNGPPPESWIGKVLLAYGVIILAGANLPATLIGSEVVLLEHNALFFFNQTIDGYVLWFPSPWLIFLILYTLLSFLFYRLCVRQVRRVATN